METSPVTCRTLEIFYHINAKTFDKQYKEVLSGYRKRDQLSHAEEWMLFPENIDPRLAIDESSLSDGELYTFVTNRDRHCKDGSLVAVVAGTKSEDVIKVLKQIKEEEIEAVEEVTLDLSDSMRCIVRSAFPKAKRVIDRFHVQKLACDAVQEIRIAHRWDAIQQSNEEWKSAGRQGKHTNRSVSQTGILERNCWPEVVICFSSQRTNGLLARNKEQKSYSTNTLTFVWHTDYAIL